MTQQLKSAFEHDQLLDRNHIRILKLEPSLEFDAEIRCRLVQKTHDDASWSYEAVSYVWGDDDNDVEKFEITCNGRSFEVHKNCMLVLRYLRQKKKTRSIWIDAVCIDQKSDADKEHQLRLMGSIYNCAKKVIIWLGEEVPGSGLRAEIRRTNSWAVLYLATCRLPLPHLAKSLTERIYARRIPTAFLPLLRQEWPRRVWTYQELILASFPVVQCGHCTLSWDAFIHRFQKAFSLPDNMLDEQLLLISPTVWKLCQRPRVTTWRFSKAARAGETPNLASPSTSNPEKLAEDRISWLASVGEFFESAAARGCKQPLDRFYGLYGALEVMGLDLPAPDYAKSEEQLAQELTVKVIQHFGSLKPLYFWADKCGRPDGASWALDWTHFTDITNQFRVWGLHFGTCAVFKECYEPDFSPGRLGLHAVLHEVKPFRDDASESLGESPYQIPPKGDAAFLWFLGTLKVASTFDNCPNGQSAWEAVCHSLLDGYYRCSEGESYDSINKKVATCLLEKGIVPVTCERHEELKRNVWSFLGWSEPSQSMQFWHKSVYQQIRSSLPMLMPPGIMPPVVERGREDDLAADSHSIRELQLATYRKALNTKKGGDFPASCSGDHLLQYIYMYFGPAFERCIAGSLFRTLEGSIGISMRRIEPGDVLALIHGSSVPAILRPVDDNYKLVGFASVHGLPDSAWPTNGNEEGVRRIVLI